jgi:hypothetical protein
MFRGSTIAWCATFGPQIYTDLVSFSVPRLVLRTMSLTLESGANGQAAVIEDIAVATSLQRLPTKSDVFALAQREVRVHCSFIFGPSRLTVVQNVLYTGLRNGGILRFDTRLQRTNSHPLFDSTSQRIRSSITGLKHLRDNQLLVSFLDGGVSISGSQCGEAAEGRIQISTFDLRFPIRTPLMTFTGNFNSYTNRLVSYRPSLAWNSVLNGPLLVAAGN